MQLGWKSIGLTLCLGMVASRAMGALATSPREGLVRGDTPVDSIQIVCDNTAIDAGCRADDGFACVVRFAGRTLLFDAGLRGATLRANLGHLGIDPKSIDSVFISHNHGDHTGGLTEFLPENARAQVFMSAEMCSNTSGAGIRQFEGVWNAAKDRVVRVPEDANIREIGPGIYASGFLSGKIPDGRIIQEQVLILDTAEGVVIVLGCSHPSPQQFVRVAVEHFRKRVSLLIGGFHLQGPGMDQGRIEGIIAELKRLGVRRCAPIHCTGELAVQLFRKHFASDCLEGGVGRVIPLAPTIKPQISMPEVFNRYRYVHGRVVFSPDGLECLWELNTEQMQKKHLMRKDAAGNWLAPGDSFLSIENKEKDPCYSPEGRQVVYQSRAPLVKGGPLGDINLWIRKRTPTGWGEAEPLGSPVNSPDWDEGSPWLGANGTLVFHRDSKTSKPGAFGGSDIFLAEMRHGRYLEPVRLGPEINSEYHEGNAVLAPDNSYLLFMSNRPGGYSRMQNLYVSHRNPDGSWSRARCLSHELKIDNIWYPSLSPDGKTLYFCGGYPAKDGYTQSHVYSVDTRFLLQ